MQTNRVLVVFVLAAICALSSSASLVQLKTIDQPRFSHNGKFFTASGLSDVVAVPMGHPSSAYLYNISSQQFQLISIRDDGGVYLDNSVTDISYVSDDGTRAVFRSRNLYTYNGIRAGIYFRDIVNKRSVPIRTWDTILSPEPALWGMSSDGQWVAWSHGDSFMITELDASGNVVREYPAMVSTSGVAVYSSQYTVSRYASLSSDGRYLAFSTSEVLSPEHQQNRKEVYLYDRVSNLTQLFAPPNRSTWEDCSSGPLSSNGLFLVISCSNTTEGGNYFQSFVFRTNTTTVDYSLSRDLQPQGISNDGRYLLVEDYIDSIFMIWDNSTRQLLSFNDNWNQLHMSPQGMILIEVANCPLAISQTFFLNASTLEQTPVLHEACPYGGNLCDNSRLSRLPVFDGSLFVSSADGTMFAVAVSPSEVNLYNRSSDSFVQLYSAPGVPFSGILNANNGFSFNENGSLFVANGVSVGACPAGMMIFDLVSQTATYPLGCQLGSGSARSDDIFVYSIPNQGLRIRNLTSNQQINFIPGLDTRHSISGNGQYVLFRNRDATYAFDIALNQTIATLEVSQEAMGAISNDGRYAIYVNQAGFIKLHDIQENQATVIYDGSAAQPATVFTSYFTISQDSRYFVITWGQNSITGTPSPLVYDRISDEILQFKELRGWTTSHTMAFGSNGFALITRSPNLDIDANFDSDAFICNSFNTTNSCRMLRGLILAAPAEATPFSPPEPVAPNSCLLPVRAPSIGFPPESSPVVDTPTAAIPEAAPTSSGPSAPVPLPVPEAASPTSSGPSTPVPIPVPEAAPPTSQVPASLPPNAPAPQGVANSFSIILEGTIAPNDTVVQAVCDGVRAALGLSESDVTCTLIASKRSNLQTFTIIVTSTTTAGSTALSRLATSPTVVQNVTQSVQSSVTAVAGPGAFTATAVPPPVAAPVRSPAGAPVAVPVESQSTTGGLQGGPIAGIIIGCIAAVAIVVFVVVLLLKRSKKQTKKPDSATPMTSSGPAAKQTKIVAESTSSEVSSDDEDASDDESSEGEEESDGDDSNSHQDEETDGDDESENPEKEETSSGGSSSIESDSVEESSNGSSNSSSESNSEESS